jgi:hypothetical protein
VAQLNVSLELRGGGTLTDSSGINPATERANLGTGDFGEIKLDLASGTGDLAANQWYLGQRTLAATTAENLDLQALANKLGTAVLTKVRGLLIRIVSPDGTKYLKVGPQNQSNGWQGPFSVVTANGWVRVDWLCLLACGYGSGIGAVDATHKVLRVDNPGAGSVTYDIWLLGVA